VACGGTRCGAAEQAQGRQHCGRHVRRARPPRVTGVGICLRRHAARERNILCWH
jgi:hypothetical protein